MHNFGLEYENTVQNSAKKSGGKTRIIIKFIKKEKFIKFMLS